MTTALPKRHTGGSHMLSCFRDLMYRFFLSIRPPAYKTMVLYTGKNPVYKTMVLYCTIFLEIGILVPNIQF